MPPLPPRSPLRADDPRRLGRYTLSGRLGRGAQGVVYLARTPDGRMVALKLLHEDRVARSGSRERLAKEAATARRVRGRCTARILDVEVGGPRPYIVSEYVAGPSLHRRVRERGPLTGAALDRLMIGTATALVAIHSAGIVHRDLKPANVLLGPEGPRVIDFGVAHVEDAAATLTGAPVGTPAYMAPEQVAGEPAGCPADVFAWASTMVYGATGQAPFGRDNPSAVMNRIAHHEPELAGLHGPVPTLLRACLRKDPDGRPPAEHVLRRLLELSARKPATRSRAAMLAAGTRAASASHRASEEDQPVRRQRRAPSDGDRRGRDGDTRAAHDPPAAGRNAPEWMRDRGPSRPNVRRARDLSRRAPGPDRARARDEAGPERPRTRPGAPGEARRARRAAEWPPPRAEEAHEGHDGAVPERMSPGKRRGYMIAVLITILVGLTLGIAYPWAASPPRTPSPGASATP